MQIAKSLVIAPDSMVSIQTASKSAENLASSVLLSNLARWARPRVHANIDAENKQVQMVFIVKIWKTGTSETTAIIILKFEHIIIFFFTT